MLPLGVLCKFMKVAFNAHVKYSHCLVLRKSPFKYISPRRLALFERHSLSHQEHTNKMDGTCNHLVFVYGTLKRGEPNHYIVQDPANGIAEYIGKARTIKTWPLVIASRYNIPFLLFQKNQGKQVIGEVYSVDTAMLAKLDELECHPKYYERLLEEVEFSEVAAGGTYKVSDVCRLWIYFLKNFRAELLNLPCLEDYASKGGHGLEYVERYKRPSGVGYHVDVMNV